LLGAGSFGMARTRPSTAPVCSLRPSMVRFFMSCYAGKMCAHMRLHLCMRGPALACPGMDGHGIVIMYGGGLNVAGHDLISLCWHLLHGTYSQASREPAAASRFPPYGEPYRNTRERRSLLRLARLSHQLGESMPEP